MHGSPGPRLRLVLRQTDGQDVAGGDPAGLDGTAGRRGAQLPEIEFVAFAAHGRLSGWIRLDRARLTDMLNDHEEFRLERVLAEHLPDGASRVLRAVLIHRHELPVVFAGGPRGDRALRTETVARSITLKLGQYLVTGDVHTTPGLDPLRHFRRRPPMVPLTDAVLEYTGPRGPVQEFADTVVVNRDLMAWMRRTETGVARGLLHRLPRSAP